MGGAGKVLGVEALPLHLFRQLLAGFGHHLHQGEPLAALEGGAQRIGEALLHPLAGHEAIDYHLDVVGVVLVELDVVGQLAHLAVDPHPGETLGHQTAEQLHVSALLAPHHGRQQLIAGALREGEDLVHHLIDGLGPDRAVALGAVGFARTAEEEPQVILNLRDRAHGGARIVAGGFLIDRDGRREPLDRIHIGFVHLTEELARVGGEALHVAALALGKNRVESERTLAAAAHAGEHHQAIAGDREIDVLEVVLAGAPYADHVLQAAAAEVLLHRL